MTSELFVYNSSMNLILDSVFDPYDFFPSSAGTKFLKRQSILPFFRFFCFLTVRLYIHDIVGIVSEEGS